MEESVELFLTISKSLSNVCITDGQIDGDLSASAELLKRLGTMPDGLFNHLVGFNGNSIFIHKIPTQNIYPITIRITLFPAGLASLGLIYLNTFRDLINFHPCRRPAKDFYIAEMAFLSTCEPVPEIVAMYLDAIRLIEILEAASDHSEMQFKSLNLIFLHNEKLEIPALFSQSDLRRILKLDEFRDTLVSSKDSDKRKIFLKSALIDLLRNIPREGRLAYLIANFGLLQEKYEMNYQIYLADFSFEKLKSEFEKEKVEYVGKLNKVMVDIQDKVILIPVAYILIGTQFEKSSDGLTIKNVFILISSLIFGYLIYHLIVNQISSLKSIHSSISSLRTRLQTEYSEIFCKIKPHFDDLSSLYNNQYKRFINIKWITIFIVFITFILFLYYSLPSYAEILMKYYG